MPIHSHHVRRDEPPGGATFVLGWAKNPLPANGPHQHWATHAAEVAGIRLITTVLGRTSRLRLDRADVALTWYVTSRRRRDADNLVPLMKALVDGLVTAAVIPDDHDLILRRHMPRIVYQPAGPAQMELVIRPLTEET